MKYLIALVLLTSCSRVLLPVEDKKVDASQYKLVTEKVVSVKQKYRHYFIITTASGRHLMDTCRPAGDSITYNWKIKK